MKLVTS